MALNPDEVRNIEAKRTEWKTKVVSSSSHLLKCIYDRESERLISKIYTQLEEAYFLFIELDDEYRSAQANDEAPHAECGTLNGLDRDAYTAAVQDIFTSSRKVYHTYFMNAARDEVTDLTAELEEELEVLAEEEDLLMIPISIDITEKITSRIVAVGKRRNDYKDADWGEVTSAIRRAGERSQQFKMGAMRRLESPINAAAPLDIPPRSDAAPATTTFQEMPTSGSTTFSTTTTATVSSTVVSQLHPLTVSVTCEVLTPLCSDSASALLKPAMDPVPSCLRVRKSVTTTPDTSLVAHTCGNHSTVSSGPTPDTSPSIRSSGNHSEFLSASACRQTTRRASCTKHSESKLPRSELIATSEDIGPVVDDTYFLESSHIQLHHNTKELVIPLNDTCSSSPPVHTVGKMETGFPVLQCGEQFLRLLQSSRSVAIAFHGGRISVSARLDDTPRDQLEVARADIVDSLMLLPCDRARGQRTRSQHSMLRHGFSPGSFLGGWVM